MEWLKSHLKAEYNIKDQKKIKMIIGWQVIRKLEVTTLKIDQSAFMTDLLEEKNLARCNSVKIPIKADSIIEIIDANDYEETNIKVYQRLIGKLIYLSCNTRPDILFAMGQLNRQNIDPRVGNLKVAK